MGCCVSKFVCELSKLEKSTIENTQEFIVSGRIECKVLKVIDGDTLVISFLFNNKIYKHSLRLYGINCPETRTRDLEEKKKGLEVKEYMTELLENKMIEVDMCAKREKYGRLLGTVYYKGENICNKLIEIGHAVRYM